MSNFSPPQGSGTAVKDATQTTAGIVKTSGTSGKAVTTDDTYYEDIKNGDYVSSFNGSKGDVTYTAPVTSVFGRTGDVALESSDVTGALGFTPANNVDVVSSFNGSKGAVTYTAPVSSVNGQTGAVTIQGDSSASGVWNIAQGSLNVPSYGTAINIAQVPSGAKNYTALGTGTVYSVDNASGVIGGVTSSTSFWAGVCSNANSGHATLSASSVSGYPVGLIDGEVQALGYFQINNGYLQFIVTSTSSSSYNASQVSWAVS